jgi:WD40 repeat protein
LAFSPNGKLLATNGPENEVGLWDLHDRSLVGSLKGHKGVVFGVAFSPDGTTLASASRDTTVQLWDIPSGQNIATLEGHDEAVWSVAFSPDGATLASAGDGNAIILWNVASRQWQARLEGHTGRVISLVFSPVDKRLASASRDGTVKLWDPQTGRLLDTKRGHSHSVHNVAFSPDGRTLASDSAGEVRLWDLSVMPERDTIAGRNVTFSDDGKTLATWTEDSELKFWDTATGESRVAPTFQHAADGCATLSPDSRQVAVGTSTGGVILYDLEVDERPQELGQHKRRVDLLVFSPTGNHLVSKAGPELKLWDLANLQLQANFEVYAVGCTTSAVAFSHDGTTLAISCDEDPMKVHSLKLWNLNRRKLTTLERRNLPITASAFSLDDAMLASGNWDGKIRIWNVKTGTQLPYTIKGHTDAVSSLVFSRSGTRLASTSEDGTVKLWDVPTGDQTITFNGHRRNASVVFSSDGGTLASADGRGTVKLWRAATKEEVRAASW